MNGRKRLVGMGAVLSMGGLALACSAAADASVLVGVAGPMTGEYASGGDQFRKGAEQAVKDINASGGVR